MKRLKEQIRKIDQKGYKAYKDLQGTYQFEQFQLSIDYVQGDPFASPSKIRVIIPRDLTVLHENWTSSKSRRIRCEDLVARKIQGALEKNRNRIKGTGKSGMVSIDAPNQKVIERTAVHISKEQITLCLSVGLPANGRRVLAKEAEILLFQVIPSVIERSVYALEKGEIEQAIQLQDQQQFIREYLRENELVAFIANGSILPRESGVKDTPLTKKVVPFKSPDSLTIKIDVPHLQDPIKGMAIKKGITLIVGGGYHGKSTLLQAIEQGVYDHIKGDGREYVITDDAAVKIRAEDGRSISNVTISPFINRLPYGKDTERFTSENASGSTSQAANIIEMLEAGAKTLLIDEDTSATNFMIRDARMQALISKESEPITPFVDKIGLLKDDLDVSTILVMGGSGDYFNVADRIIKMEQYVPNDVTEDAKKIAALIQTDRKNEGGTRFGSVNDRVVLSKSLSSQKGAKQKVAVRSMHYIQFGHSEMNLQYVEQIVDASQTRMIAESLLYIERTGILNKNITVKQLLSLLEEKIEKEGLCFASIHSGHPGELAKPRKFELAAALNRLRSLQCGYEVRKNS
ncbi:isopentenyl-diphosphate delta-isomerase [Halalkalibacter wakoensis JCM 9140]|uniref:Isopentenyl-diphosphate delta-isomerase n=1 Tax=Halalkalibacter wakoensis JCM 9140 TaxID=1236970 RepID=W4Q2L9_9BACI|nr:ABC-ATPase domain-containing protein [Halalkalibacter wakoensis]GAE25609.1 isopentenyl-diphosphate delta-isomerase [Halalkalibacter wakoensis JCM 9140]